MHVYSIVNVQCMQKPDSVYFRFAIKVSIELGHSSLVSSMHVYMYIPYISGGKTVRSVCVAAWQVKEECCMASVEIAR